MVFSKNRLKRSAVIRALRRSRRRIRRIVHNFSFGLWRSRNRTGVSRVRLTARYRPTVTHLPQFQAMLDKVRSLKEDDLYFYMRSLESSSAGNVVIRGRRMIMLGSNNYLGLTVHPAVKRAAIHAIEEFGTGAGGVRILSGTYKLHEQLEERLAELKRTEAVVVFAGGYLTNLAAISTLCELGYVMINDEKNHASIIDGCKVRKARAHFYHHNDMTDLERLLSSEADGTGKFIVVDGVFSMDGDIVDLPGVLRLARRYGARVYVDDAHATGVLGRQGRGTAEHYGMEGLVNVVAGTLSKALGAVGGFIAGPKDLVDYLKHASRAFVFGSALPPCVAATVLASLDVIRDEPEHLEKLRANTKKILDGLRNIGFNVHEGGTPILPVIVGEELLAYRLARLLDEFGIFVNPVAYPAVKPKEARIRVSVNALLTDRDIGTSLVAFERAGRMLGLI